MIYLEHKEWTEHFAIYDTFEEFDQTVKKWYHEQERNCSPMEFILNRYNIYMNGLKVEA